MLKTKLIIASTRPGRKGISVANWIKSVAETYPEMELEVLDLAEINLPLLDEPNHPRLKQYEKQHTKDWSAKIDSGEAFIIVMPEYNFSFNAAIKNAIDFLFQEWHNKPVALVSYGGVSGGIRAVQMIKPVLLAVSLVPIPESVMVPMFTQFIREDGTFEPNETLSKSANNMMKGLMKWGKLLKSMETD